MPSTPPVRKAWEQQHKMLRVWLPLSEYISLKQDCDDTGLTMTDYIRRLIKERDGLE